MPNGLQISSGSVLPVASDLLGQACKCRRFVILIALLCIGRISSGQNYLTSTGSPPFSAPEPSEYGFVDNANGNLYIALPLASYPQRGSRKPEPILFTFNSNRAWTQGGGGSGPFWTPDRGGWTHGNNEALNGYLTGVGDGLPTQQGGWCVFDETFAEPSGTQHPFPPINAVEPGDPYCSGPAKADVLAADSSGYHLYDDCSQIQVYQSCLLQVYAPDGTIVYQIAGSGIEDPQGNQIWIKDANGNYISQSNTTNYYFDTLGRQLGGLGELNSQNAFSNYTLTNVNIPLKTTFGQPGVAECPSPCTMNTIGSIGLPDGTSFSFKYDCDSTSGNPACGSPAGQSAYYGMLVSMTLPTGGQVNYSWTLVTDPYSNKHLWLASRTASGGRWSYSVRNLSTCSPTQVGCQQQVTSTSPTGEKTVYTFTLNNGDWPVQILRYDASANLIATVNTTWDFSGVCPWYQCHGAVYVRRVSEAVTYPVPGGTSITKKTTYAYDSPQNGNVKAVQEWRFLPGTNPSFLSVPDRATYVTYYTNSGMNIINKPLTTTLCNNSGTDSDCPGGGSKVSQTKVTYDSYGQSGLVAVSGVTHHDDTNFGTGNTIRGNPTQIQQWVSGTYLTTLRTYDTTGQVLSSTDAAGNTTTYSYTDNNHIFDDNGANPPQAHTGTTTNAYLTGVTLPTVGGVSMKVSMGYYFGSGKRAIFTDVNGQSSYFHFVNPVTLVNDPFDRATESVLPIGWSLTNYTSPTEADTYAPVADTSPSSGCSSCRHNEFLFDTWGRKVTEGLYMPDSSRVDVNTTYDTNGRVYQVSHPGTSVFETFSYDGLNRKTAVTHPDNQSLRTAFGPNVGNLGGLTSQQLSASTYGYGYPVISVDETGKPRQEWIDGFGKVIEVDEPSGSGTGSAPTATVTVSGSEGTHDVCHGDICVTHFDTGTVTITVNGYVATTSWLGASTSITLATALANQLNSPSRLLRRL
jgi:YD repeat-containing protein